jgi:hypothetical protein
LQVTLLGAPGTDVEQFSALLRKVLETMGLPAKIAIATPINEPFEADLIFLMGLQGTRAEDVAADRLWREMLAREKLAHQVLYGTQGERLAQALDVIRNDILDAPDIQTLPNIRPDQQTTSGRLWLWNCDKCSDPQCEHRLLTGLLASRAASALTGQLP